MTEAATAQAAASQRGCALQAFEAYGLELEYMLVAQASLDVLPVADEVFELAGAPRGSGDLDRGACAWSNELVRHVVELKNPAPCELARLPHAFQAEVDAFAPLLRARGVRLMPGGMHPWMDPARETMLWPHGNGPIYRAYDRIFGCRAHGWANLQSTHINLPFAGDAQFARLHAAIRVALPIIPALAASSPYCEGRAAADLDARMTAYRLNSTRVPALAGDIVPPQVSTREEYERVVLQPMYRDIAPLDPEGVLQDEWLNAHGAIARFSRSAIEIRVMDVQECPAADVALAGLIVDLVQALYEEAFAPATRLAAAPVPMLAEVLLACVRDAERARIAQADYLQLFGLDDRSCDARHLWAHLAARLAARGARHEELWAPVAAVVLEQGPLARRLLRAAGPAPSAPALHATYRALCACLAEGRLYLP